MPIHAHSNTQSINIAIGSLGDSYIILVSSTRNQNSRAHYMTQPTHHSCQFVHILIHNPSTSQFSWGLIYHSHATDTKSEQPRPFYDARTNPSSMPIHAHSNTQSNNIAILLGTHIILMHKSTRIRTDAPIIDTTTSHHANSCTF